MSDLPSPRRALGAASRAAVALAPLLLSGCAVSYSTLEPVTDFGRAILDVYGAVLWVTIGIFVVVEALLLFALWRFRSRPDDPDVPEQVHGHTLVEIGWTLAPALILFLIAIPTVQTVFRTQAEPPGEDPLEIRVVGNQWWWKFEYLDLGFTTANEMHVPRGRTVRLTLTSDDVIHSFWVPRLGGKRDLNPGSENTLWFTADTTGVYEGHCAELCGTSHANMRLRVFVDEPDVFEAWAEEMASPAEPDSAGFQAFLASGCAACHAIDGTPAQGRMGPNLTRIGDRTTIAAAMLPNTPDEMAAWLRDPDSLKPGVLMPDLELSEERIDLLVRMMEDLR
ncbi:MAG: cytochrome c oxidase subunit II [Gemmatimonadota bacterium]|nr:cytochrome c oxidase subunit II [Gemmatimonadota bacterium]